MMLLLGDCRAHQAAMPVENGLREAGRPTGEVDDAQIIVINGDTGVFRGEMTHAKVVAVGERRAVLTHKIQVLDLGNAVDNLFDAANEFWAENKHLDIGKLEAVLDLVGSVAIVHGNRDGARLQHAEVNRKPLKAVHHQDAHLAFAFHAGVKQQMRETIGAVVEHFPRHLAAITLRRVGLDQLVLAPRLATTIADLGVHLDQRDLFGPLTGVLL